MRLVAPLADEIKSQSLNPVSSWCILARGNRRLFWWLFVLYFPAVSCTPMQPPYFVTLCDDATLQRAAFSCKPSG